MGHLLADRHAAATFHAQQLGLAIDASAKHAVDKNERPGIVAPGGGKVLRMMQAVMLGGVEQKPPPSGRIEAHIDMLIDPDRQAEGAGDQHGAWREVEKAADAEPDKKQLHRITHRALIDVQLGDIVMHRVRQP